MRHLKILFFVTLICSVNTNIYSEESAKDIIEKRKSLFSANYKTAKRVDILSKDELRFSYIRTASGEVYDQIVLKRTHN